MKTRVFESPDGRIWIVTKRGSSVKVKGQRNTSESLSQIARNCALKLGIHQTRAGMPLEYVNEHRRIWNAIWDKGREA